MTREHLSQTKTYHKVRSYLSVVNLVFPTCYLHHYNKVLAINITRFGKYSIGPTLFNTINWPHLLGRFKSPLIPGERELNPFESCMINVLSYLSGKIYFAFTQLICIYSSDYRLFHINIPGFSFMKLLGGRRWRLYYKKEVKVNKTHIVQLI